MRSFQVLAVVAAPALAVETRASTSMSANPIRKVVNMLQMMQKKVEAEGEKEKELFEKFMCYCKNSGGDLGKSIADAEGKVSELPSQIEEAQGELKQLKEDLKQAQADRAAAKTAMDEATAIREKEAAAYAKESGELKTNLGAMKKALAALDKGAGGAFLQTSAASVLKRIVLNDNNMEDVDREDLTSFLAGGSEDGSQSVGAVVGILKQMTDTMDKTLADVTATEDAAIKTYEQLMKAKTEEVDALTGAIEDKTQRIGDLGVQIVGMKEDLSDAGESLLEDKKFLAELEKSCATKEKEWAEIQKTRSEELLALADTIKILNDDDALELFKKTLPGASSFLQMQVTEKSMREQALSLLNEFRKHQKGNRQRIDFIMMAVRGKKVGFDKIIKMIDDMVALLKQEGVEDENKKEYCEEQFDQTDDKKKELERALSKLEKSIDEAKETVATLTDDIAGLEEGIVALDKSVAEATEQRKEENSDYTTLMASDSTAKELLAFAKNRLNKFYNPKLYKAPPKRQLTEEERVTLNMGGTLAPTSAPGGIAGTGIGFVQSHDAPPPPPETFGAYSKKSEESGGVISMIDALIKELDTEMTEAEVNEKNGQEEYEEMMADSAAKRAADSKSIQEKAGQKADLEKALVEFDAEKSATNKELFATIEYIGQLHGECDWLIKFFDMRKEARNGEIDALGKAKAVLNGADFSFVQTKHSKFLRRA